MCPEDPRLLGNLPRTRPGTRSPKREAEGPAAERPPRSPEPPDDPVGDALRGAASFAGSGLKVADGVARELLRRLRRS